MKQTESDYGGTVCKVDGKLEWTGKINLIEDKLDLLYQWKKPQRIFVNSMADLFHKDVPFEFIDRLFVAMEENPHHTYQILTKRPARMREFVGWRQEQIGKFNGNDWNPEGNIHLLVSCSTQSDADRFIPDLLKTPATVRGVSLEPLIGPVDLTEWLTSEGDCDLCNGEGSVPVYDGGKMCPKCNYDRRNYMGPAQLDWIVIGGESGPMARSCDQEWIRSIVKQCASAEVPCFVKQMGSNSLRHTPDGQGAWSGLHRGGKMIGVGNFVAHAVNPRYRDGAGRKPETWPEDLRVQQFPEVSK